MIEQVLFYILLCSSIFHLGQMFFYGFQESNRPMILFGSVFLFLAFSLDKDLTWVNWALVIVPSVGFIAALTGFADSLKPNWLNYTLIFINLLLTIFGIINLFG